MSDKMTLEQMTRAAYFGQRLRYASMSKGVLVPISQMDQRHAANAAARLLADAYTMAEDCGEVAVTIPSATLWMMHQPLWQALVARAGGAA
jgi:hypothetical protein